jgi:hypothetical protein
MMRAKAKPTYTWVYVYSQMRVVLFARINKISVAMPKFAGGSISILRYARMNEMKINDEDVYAGDRIACASDDNTTLGGAQRRRGIKLCGGDDEEQSSTNHAEVVAGERLRRGTEGERLAFLKRSLEGEGVVKVKAE